MRSGDYRGPDGNPSPDVLRPSPEVPLPGQWVPPPTATPSERGSSPAAADDPDLALVEHLRHGGIPVVAVFLTGRPRGITPELQASNAFVVAWLPGTEGAGIADVLFRNGKGDVNFDFTGKLSYSWPAVGGQYSSDSLPDKAAPLFPYGFGLSYCKRHCDAPLSRESWPTQQSLTSRNTPASR